jgi:hypothetical protein
MVKTSDDCGGERVAIRSSWEVNRFVNGADNIDRVGEFGLKGISLGFGNLDLRVVVAVVEEYIEATKPKMK